MIIFIVVLSIFAFIWAQWMFWTLSAAIFAFAAARAVTSANLKLFDFFDYFKITLKLFDAFSEFVWVFL